MKKLMVFLVLGTLILSSLSIALAANGNNSNNGNLGNNTNEAPYGNNTQEQDRDRIRNMTKDEIKAQIQDRNRIHFQNKTGQNCTEGCTCTGVVMKCQIENGTRQKTVYASSGNTIIQSKGINASTQVQLYKANNTLVGEFKNGNIKQIRMTPEQVQQKIQEKIQQRLQDMNISLNEEGYYQVQTQKNARFLGLFKVKERTNWEIDPETGEIVRVRNSWWGWLANDEEDKDIIVGASCGTVTPGQNDACCQNKGYDYWNSESGECLFNDVE